MANDLTSNPLWADTAGTLIAEASPAYVQAIQWIDDPDADIADTNTLVMTINGVAISMIVTDVNTQMSGVIAYEIIFPKPMLVHTLVLDTINNGALLIWTV